MLADRARIQLSFLEQISLIGADLLRPKLVGGTMEIVGEGLHDLQVAFHGSLRVITTLELFQHHFAKLGHRDLLVTHTLRQTRRNASTYTHAQRPPRGRLRSNGDVGNDSIEAPAETPIDITA